MADKKPSRQRSKVANGTVPLPGIDGRSLWARRYKEILSALIADAGGEDYVTEATRTILKRAAVLAAELERRACARLELTGSPVVELVAVRILELARDGECDPDKLTDAAVLTFEG
jgi:hypothetical protein